MSSALEWGRLLVVMMLLTWETYSSNPVNYLYKVYQVHYKQEAWDRSKQNVTYYWFSNGQTPIAQCTSSRRPRFESHHLPSVSSEINWYYLLLVIKRCVHKINVKRGLAYSQSYKRFIIENVLLLEHCLQSKSKVVIYNHRAFIRLTSRAAFNSY